MPLNQYVFSLCIAIVVVTLIGGLLRRRQLREKYALLWLVVGSATLVLSAAPQLLAWLADAADVAVPSNLLFLVAILLLLGVCMHLSWEVSRQEDRTRLLAEEVALLRLRIERQHTTGVRMKQSGDQGMSL